VWIVFVTVLSLLPLKIKQAIGTQGALHNWAHCLVFVVTAVLLGWRANRVSSQLVRFAIALGFAISLEGLQTILYGNSFEWWDLYFDSLGALMGCVLTISVTKSLTA
jgi:glycopeptide antibiotics resistance protein